MRKILLAAVCLVGLSSLAHGQAVRTAGFAPDTGLVVRRLMTECVGSRATPATLADTTGRFLLIMPTSNGPACNGDGSLVWPNPGTTGYITEPPAVQTPSGGTFEISFAGAVSSAMAYENLGGYTGTNPSIEFGLRPNYAGTGSQGNGDKWVSYQEINASGAFMNPTGSITTGAIDNALHDVIATWTPAGVVTEYLDSVPVPQFGQGSGSWSPMAMTGGNWQWGGLSTGASNCSPNYCGYGGRIYGMSISTSQITAQNAVVDHNALVANAVSHGAVTSPYYGPTGGVGSLVAMGESTTFGDTLPSPATQSPAVMAASYLSATAANGGFGQTFGAYVDGNDSNTAYNMAGACQRELRAQAMPGTGIKLAVLASHSNGAAVSGVTDGVQTLSPQLGWPGVTTTAATAIQDVAELGRCVRQEMEADSYAVILVGDGMSVQSTPSSYANDTKQKNAYNRIFRQFVTGSGARLVDFANDPRFGADGASASGGWGGGPPVNNCTLDTGGPAVPAYSTGNGNPDGIHMSVCGAQLEGHMEAASFAVGLNTRYGIAPAVLSSATSIPQLLNQAGATFYLTGASASLTILPVSGLAPGTLIATATNNGNAPDPIMLGTNYNGGSANTLPDGTTTTYSLPVGATRRFYVGPVTDATGIAPVLVL